MKMNRSIGASASVLLCILITLFAVGCGSSGDDVFIGGGGGSGTTGDLEFRFVQPQNQAPDPVPSGTETLRFDVFSTDPPTEDSLLLTETRDYDETIVLEDVSVEAVTVLVTAFDADGVPTVTLSGDVLVLPNSINRVDLVDSQPVTLDTITISPSPVQLANDETQQLALEGSFSNGTVLDLPQSSFDTAATFSSADTDVATVDNDGVVSVEGAGNTSITAQYTLSGVTRSDTVEVQAAVFDVTVTFVSAVAVNNPGADNFNAGIGSTTTPTYTARLTGPDQNQVTVPLGSLTFAFQPDVTGFSVGGNGQVTVADTVANNTTANLVVSYTNESNQVFTDTLVVTALAP